MGRNQVPDSFSNSEWRENKNMKLNKLVAMWTFFLFECCSKPELILFREETRDNNRNSVFISDFFPEKFTILWFEPVKASH